MLDDTPTPFPTRGTWHDWNTEHAYAEDELRQLRALRLDSTRRRTPLIKSTPNVWSTQP